LKLSIVTINLNNYQGLKKTLESINSLDLTGIEFIVIDGASTDGSVELIQSYSKIITHALIEKDSGIYNAMNKGVKLAKGDYLYFLNSGDVLLSSFPQIINSLDNTSSYAFSVLSERNNQIKPFNPKDFGYVKYYDFAFPHQGFIFKKEVFDRFGYYDESYKMLADFKLILQIALSH
jgi:glycosyltransferase involved in cell wall biosynthesis